MKKRWGDGLKTGVGICALVTASCFLASPVSAWAAASTSADAVKQVKVENAALQAKDKDLEARIDKLETTIKAQQKEIDTLTNKGSFLQVPRVDGIVGAPHGPPPAQPKKSRPAAPPSVNP